MGIKDFFHGGKKPPEPETETGRVPAPAEKIERLNALFLIGCSIQKASFRAARAFLAARHGYDTSIPARVLYLEADQVFLEARKLAREIGDRKKEAEILYNWALLQWHPPLKSVSFMSGTSVADKLDRMSDLVSRAANEPEGKGADREEASVESLPQLALQFFLEAVPLAEETGDDAVAAACLLYAAQIHKARGDTAEYRNRMEMLRRKIMRISKAGTPLPQWLINEIKEEAGF